MMRKFSMRESLRKTQSVKLLAQETPEVQQSEFWRSTVRVLDAEYLSSINSSNFRDSSVTVHESSFSGDESERVDLTELDWDFDPFTRSADWLLDAAVAMFRTERSFVISDETLYAFLSTVRLNYHDNPFHNWYHAFSVLQVRTQDWHSLHFCPLNPLSSRVPHPSSLAALIALAALCWPFIRRLHSLSLPLPISHTSLPSSLSPPTKAIPEFSRRHHKQASHRRFEPARLRECLRFRPAAGGRRRGCYCGPGRCRTA